MTDAVHIVLSIFAMIGVGMWITHLGWLEDGGEALISKLVTRVGLPGMIIYNMLGQFTRQGLIESAPGLAIPFLSLGASYVLSGLAARLIKVPAGRRGTFRNMFTFSNSVFVGLPVSIALFGESVVPYSLLYYIANTTLFWTIGISGFQGDAGAKQGQPGVWARLRTVFTLPLCTFLVCVALVLLGVGLPRFLMDAARYTGQIVTPLSQVFTGCVLCRMLKKREISWQRGFGMVCAGRFLISPALFLLLARLIDTPDLMRHALFVQAAMPVMGQTPILAAQYGADEGYAAGGIAVTTLLSLVFIPLYMGIMPWI